VSRLWLWEWLYAGGMGLTALGWAALCGPMFPTTPELQNFVWVMIIFVAFSGMVLVASSRIAFFAFIIPTLLPGLYRFYEMTGGDLPALVAALACTAVMLITHHGLRGFSLDHLRRQVQAEQLLAEQQAIFQGATIGIAVFDGGVMIKCNKRFGELFGRGITAMQQTHAIELFMQPDEGERFIEWARGEFDAGRPAQSMERMRRADGSQFWAEISGRQLRYSKNVRNLWMVTDATMRQGAQR
jgi:PAS domain S-box-containing protein